MLPKLYVSMSVTMAKLRTNNALILLPRIIAMGAPQGSFTFALNARGCWPFPLNEASFSVKGSCALRRQRWADPTTRRAKEMIQAGRVAVMKKGSEDGALLRISIKRSMDQFSKALNPIMTE
jgi:hypothetical protein